MGSSASETHSASVAKPVRKDSARNRALLIEAGRTVFAEHGLDATLDDVASAAGLGVGTAYRHFSDKQELAREIMAQAFQQLVEDAHAALLIPDAWQALSGFLELSASRLVVNRGLHQAMFGSTSNHKTPLRADLVDAISELFARARVAGVLRPGIEFTDALVLYAMMGVASDVGRVVSADQWHRALNLVLDGMRATDRGPLATPAIPIDRLDDALAAIRPRRR